MDRRPELKPWVVVEMTEWDHVNPSKDGRLNGLSFADDMEARRLAEKLREKVDIREGYEGLEITSNSFVGHVDVGSIRISIRPKLPAMPLTRLLRYAYGLRDVRAFAETNSPTVTQGLHDLLISLLSSEAEELLYGGLARRYVPISSDLDSPRGRILIAQVIRRGGVREARLPCIHFDRRADWHLNQVLRAGLELAAMMAEDRALRHHVNKLSAMFDGVERWPTLRGDDIDRAERELTRLTAACAPALTIIRLLLESQGADMETGQTFNRTPGFLFDMNVFFQRLLSRFLRENLVDFRIEDEVAIRHLFAYAPDANPRHRRAPAPRPDYALFQDKVLEGFLDAKYRDVWERGYPAAWLYQLSIYALASPSEIGILLYATMHAGARDERVDVRQPVTWSSKRPASVIVRPVPLLHLADILGSDKSRISINERQKFASQLVALRDREFQQHKAIRR